MTYPLNSKQNACKTSFLDTFLPEYTKHIDLIKINMMSMFLLNYIVLSNKRRLFQVKEKPQSLSRYLNYWWHELRIEIKGLNWLRKIWSALFHGTREEKTGHGIKLYLGVVMGRTTKKNDTVHRSIDGTKDRPQQYNWLIIDQYIDVVADRRDFLLSWFVYLEFSFEF